MSQKIIYLKGYPSQGEVLITRSRPAFSFFCWASRSLLIGGLAIIILLVGPFFYLEARWRLGRTARIEPETSGETSISSFAQTIQDTDREILRPVDDQFSLLIPKIGVNSPVLTNVPLDDKKAYNSALQKGVAHAAGSYLPGEKGIIYLFAHSTDYVWNIARLNAIFYLLKELEVGDEVDLFYQNQRYLYRVVDKAITEADDLSFLKARLNEEKLILQTCWPPGTTWKRLTVKADKA